MSDASVNILLVEDNESDIRLTEIALQRAKFSNALKVARDGESALRMLERQPPFEGESLPDIVLLDLNLPRVHGSEVLRRIREREDLKHLPVVILTTSEAERDVLECYKNHANCYIAKPTDFARFMEVVQSIEHFWLKIAKLPPRGEPS